MPVANRVQAGGHLDVLVRGARKTLTSVEGRPGDLSVGNVLIVKRFLFARHEPTEIGTTYALHERGVEGMTWRPVVRASVQPGARSKGGERQ